MKFTKFGFTVVLSAVMLIGCDQMDKGEIEHKEEAKSVQVNENIESVCSDTESEKYDNSPTNVERTSNESYEYVIAGSDHVHNWREVERTEGNDCAADVSVLKECLLCGLQKMETVAGVGHDYEMSVVEATCKTAGYTQFVCKRCGNSYETDQTALLSHVEVSAVEQQAGCEVDGIVKYYCEICDTVLRYENIKHEGHIWTLTSSGIACKAGAVNEYTCSKCKKVKTEALSGTHTWSRWRDITVATCEKEGLRGRTCSVCGEYEKQTVSALGHKDSAWVVKTAATCSSQGLKTKTCSVCGEVTDKSTIAVLGHVYGEWVVDKSADCTEKGLRHRDCTNCGKRLYEDIGNAEHHYEWVTVREATCTQQGLKAYKCTVCGEQSETEDIDIAQHSMLENPTTIVKEGCTTDGYSIYSCRDCSYTETVRYSALGHQWEHKDDTDVCSRCGEVKTDG